MAKKVTLTPAEMIAQGKELIRKAKAKEEENRKRLQYNLGAFMVDAEANNFYPTFQEFMTRLQAAFGREINTPTWVQRPPKTETQTENLTEAEEVKKRVKTFGPGTRIFSHNQTATGEKKHSPAPSQKLQSESKPEAKRKKGGSTIKDYRLNGKSLALYAMSATVPKA